LGALGRITGAVPAEGPPPEGLAFQALAEAELTRLRGQRVTKPWDLARVRFQEVGAAYPAAYAEFRAAEALALAGAPAREAGALLKTAYASALDIASPPFLADVTGLAHRLGIPLEAPVEPERVRPSADLGLTERELEVLRLLGDGRTNRQIGEELFITPKTASVHVSRILMKLGVHNRAEATAVAHRLGLAAPGGPEVRQVPRT
ncbi:MAG: response regulator transcription factor, partial [Solirubrobacterales bacterium]|nr:response regulator transcription factor [Solirubrobacterales bacterium]